MQYITEINSYHDSKQTAVTLGKFESLHRGHQKLIDRIKMHAGNEIKSIVFAFDMDKDTLLTNEERRQRLEDQVDCLIECPFTKEIREIEAEDFIHNILVDKLHAVFIVVGTDFRFGHNKRGDAGMLQKYAAQYGYQVEVIEKEKYKGREISSTYISQLLKEGDARTADELLGYSYHISGTVEYGKQLGRTLGFPTMNIAPPPHKSVPRFGVYACNVLIDGAWFHGIGNVGTKPTVSNEKKTLVEVFVFGYQGDAYGKAITVEFCAFERPETKFYTVDELKGQVDQDIQFGIEYFGI